MDENVDRGRSDLQGVGDLSNRAGQEQPVPPDAVLSAVADEHRRAVIDALNSATNSTLGYEALVDHVADRVRDKDAVRESDERRQRVRIQLHHTHLPKLEEVGVIDYEAETRHVQFVGGEFEQELLTLVTSYNGDE